MMLCLPCQRLKKEGITSSHIVAASCNHAGRNIFKISRARHRDGQCCSHGTVRLEFIFCTAIPILARHDIVGLFNDSHTTVERCVIDPTALNKLNRPLKYAACMLRCDPPVHQQTPNVHDFRRIICAFVRQTFIQFFPLYTA
jgi:hypothetical protein